MVAVSQRANCFAQSTTGQIVQRKSSCLGCGVCTAHFVGVIGAVSPDREQVVTGA